MRSELVLVTGAPGTGKSTLAEPLAQALGWPLISKDVIKEAIWRGFSPAELTLDWSRQAGAAAMETLWALAARAPAAVVEAAFRPRGEHDRRHLASLNACVVEVHCFCPRDVAQRRYAERHRDGTRHVVHVLPELTDALWEEFAGTLDLGPLIEVDTTLPLDVAGIAATARGLLGPVW